MMSLHPLTDKTFLGIKKHLTVIEREERRLAVRMIAVERYARIAKNTFNDETNDDDAETFSEVVANIEAVQYDLSTYVAQLRDRVTHIEKGLASLVGMETPDMAFVAYVEEDSRLCARDVTLAREGYDDLIENIYTITQMRDNDQ
jgi:hypothetical protein